MLRGFHREAGGHRDAVLRCSSNLKQRDKVDLGKIKCKIGTWKDRPSHFKASGQLPVHVRHSQRWVEKQRSWTTSQRTMARPGQHIQGARDLSCALAHVGSGEQSPMGREEHQANCSSGHETGSFLTHQVIAEENRDPSTSPQRQSAPADGQEHAFSLLSTSGSYKLPCLLTLQVILVTVSLP